MLKRLLHLLTKDLTGQTWTEEVTHPYFGKMILFASKKDTKSYWECELCVEGRSIFVAVHSPDRLPPTPDQVRFAQSILTDLDAAFAKAAPVLQREYQAQTGRSLSNGWRHALQLEGLSVPVDGNASEAWDLSFSDLLDPANHHWTCYFEGGTPKNVTVDG